MAHINKTQGELEAEIKAFVAKPPKLDQVDTSETERIMAELIREEKNICVVFKESFLDAMEGRR